MSRRCVLNTWRMTWQWTGSTKISSLSVPLPCLPLLSIPLWNPEGVPLEGQQLLAELLPRAMD